jgi:hypothetical protein
MRNIQAFFTVILLFNSSLFTAVASAEDWTLLGSREVFGRTELIDDSENTENAENPESAESDEATDRTAVSVIHVDAKEGRFSRLRIDADNAPVEFQRIHVTFDNDTETSTDTSTSTGIGTSTSTSTGTDTEVIPGQTIHREALMGKPGEEIVFDLKDGPRKVKNVMLVYKAHSPDFEKATVELFGQQ